MSEQNENAKKVVPLKKPVGQLEQDWDPADAVWITEPEPIYRLGLTGLGNKYEVIYSTELTGEEAKKAIEAWRTRSQSIYSKISLYKKIEEHQK